MKISHKKTKHIFLFILISVLLLGMCYECTQADSSLMYGIMHEEDSLLCSSAQIRSLSEQLCSESFGRLSSGSVFLRGETARSVSRSMQERNLFFLLAELLLSVTPFLFACARIRQKRLVIRLAIIVAYMHHQDGRKRS